MSNYDELEAKFSSSTEDEILQWISNGDRQNGSYKIHLAARFGMRLVLAFLVKTNPPEYYWNEGLSGACRGGHRDIVDMMIEKGAYNWDRGMTEACEGGHTEIITLMIENGASWWSWAMIGACRGGNMDILNWMIAKGGDDWNWGMAEACRHGHLEVVKKMVEKGANNWDRAINEACVGDHFDIACFVIEKGNRSWDQCMSYACCYGNTNMALKAIEQGATNFSYVFNSHRLEDAQDWKYDVVFRHYDKIKNKRLIPKEMMHSVKDRCLIVLCEEFSDDVSRYILSFMFV